MHTMPPNTDRPINRAMVVGCAVSATRNHLKLHEPRRLKVLFCNIHAKTRKLWKHSAMRLAAFRTNAANQFTNRPLMNSVCPPRCPLHSPGLTCMRACTSPRAGAASTIEIATNIRSPKHSLHCRVPYFPRLRALELFGRRPPQRVDSLVMPASENLHRTRRGGSTILANISPDCQLDRAEPQSPVLGRRQRDQ